MIRHIFHLSLLLLHDATDLAERGPEHDERQDVRDDANHRLLHIRNPRLSSHVPGEWLDECSLRRTSCSLGSPRRLRAGVPFEPADGDSACGVVVGGVVSHLAVSRDVRV